MLKYLPLVLLWGCGIQNSPWESNPPARDLTSKHLDRLLSKDSNFAPFRFALAGDSQAVIEDFANVVDAVNEKYNVEFMLMAGDLTDLGFKKEFEWLNKAITRSNKPVLTVVGNHDGLANGSKIYQEMFGPLNYSFIYKDIKFVMWNNNPYEWDVDFDFLEREVDSHDRVIVVSHQPPYGNSMSQEENEWWKAIREKHNMIASLHGHLHKQGFHFENGKPIYTVDRVIGTSFAVIEITEDQIQISRCNPLCQPQKQ